jgi:hypothetical protein
MLIRQPTILTCLPLANFFISGNTSIKSNFILRENSLCFQFLRNILLFCFDALLKYGVSQLTLSSLRARTDYANRACNVTCNVMLVAKLVPRTADEPSTQRTAILCPLMIDCTLFYRHRDECLHFITFAISLILEE